MLIYLLKANLLLAALYALYRLMLHRDTFFAWRRTTLLGIIAVSLLAPLPALHGWTDIIPGHVANGMTAAEAWLPEFIATPQDTEAGANGSIWLRLLAITYAAGVLLLTGRIGIQLLAIMRLARHCPRTEAGGTRIRLLPRGEAPFSFFRLIFVCPEAHSPEELDEILAHEQTHARQGHSIDVLTAELACAFCWLNPTAWLLKRDVRNNLEYLADHHVLASGHDPRSYQYHLLGLAYPKAAANIYNNFNVLPLKERIRMMNRRKTRSIGRLKYLFFLPVAALLATACDGNQTQEQTAGQPAQEQAATPTKEADITEVVVISHDENMTQAQVYDIAEVPPEFPKGIPALMKFLSENVKYPKDAQDAKKEGRVIAQFVVTTDGSIADVKIIRGVYPSLDEEAIRVIKSMPKWKPGTQDGKPINVRYTLPVMFKLQ